MPSGGPRPRSGPPQQRGALRRVRGGDAGWIALPATGREGEPPPWPFERETWEREWRRPQAVQGERLGWEVRVALYVRTLKAAAAPRAAAATTTNLLRQMDSLGLTDGGMARARWYIADEAPTAAAPKRAPSTSAKERLAVIMGGADARAS